jgi:hypothetical protein
MVSAACASSDTASSTWWSSAPDELAICRDCYDAAAHFGRLSGGHPILFDLEHLP